ncbi:MAG: T9SS type A sorting domain-containing protein [Flavobacteriales bacterium]|nr:T9SS type A sorting domain-containing protein [Flavobacteriales bacterium]
MNKVLLVVLSFCFFTYSYSQVVPTVVPTACGTDPLYADSSLGVWPDTTDNIPCTRPNVGYKTILQVKVPLDAGDIDAALAGNNIIEARVKDVDGLPGGMVVQVNSAAWAGGGQGCAVLTGQTSALGTHNISINTEGDIDVGNGNVATEAITFGGYKLVVDNACTTPPVTVSEVAKHGFALGQNSPNPSGDNTWIEVESIVNGSAAFVVYNMLGEAVFQRNFGMTAGKNVIQVITQDYPTGLYTYTIEMNGKKLSKKMIVNR